MKNFIGLSFKFALYCILTVTCIYTVGVFAADVISDTFVPQTATASGSNGSLISVDENLLYINKGNNSSVIGNYFTGYYFDSVLGVFNMNWSSQEQENIRIIASTPKCTTGYGYKLGGFAYSETSGIVDFDYNNNIYVYYCVDDGQLHGTSYSQHSGYQNFQGISFDIGSSGNTPTDTPTSTGAFVNDTNTIINSGNTSSSSSSSSSSSTSSSGGNPGNNSNFSNTTIQNEIIEFNAVRESLFYIIK